MIRKIVCASMAVAVWATVAANTVREAVSASGGRPQTELVASVEFAPFSDYQRKISDFGNTINQPVVSMMAVPALQNLLTENFGDCRPDAPMKLLCYADVAAVRKMLEAPEAESSGSLDDAVEPAFIYPCAQGVAKFIENHPEAKKKADGVIELEDGNVVLFSQDERTCVFASKVDVAERALASTVKPPAAQKKQKKQKKPGAPRKLPLVRVDLKKGGIAILADLHRKMQDEQQKVLKSGGMGLAPCQSALLAAVTEFQQSMGLRQNAVLRDVAHFSLSMDFDKTGFVVKGTLKPKHGAAASPAAGFTLPAGALADVPAGAPLFGAMNPLLSSDVRNEEEFRTVVGALGKLANGLFACIKEASPKNAQAVDGVNAATAELLTAIPYPAPTDWNMFALAFGPQQEPYLVGAGEGARVSQGYAATTRFYAAVAEALGKKWPGIVNANGASLTIDWARLIDVVAAETGGSPAHVEKVKKAVGKILGGMASEISTVMPSQTSYRTFAGTKGFTPPAAVSGEKRLAAALPETVAKRPSGVFYLSLYSLLRDHVMPIAVKVASPKDGEKIRPVMDVLPEAGANGALAYALWSEKNGACRFLLRVTTDEIRSIGAAANAIISARSQPTE